MVLCPFTSLDMLDLPLGIAVTGCLLMVYISVVLVLILVVALWVLLEGTVQLLLLETLGSATDGNHRQCPNKEGFIKQNVHDLPKEFSKENRGPWSWESYCCVITFLTSVMVRF